MDFLRISIIKELYTTVAMEHQQETVEARRAYVTTAVKIERASEEEEILNRHLHGCSAGWKSRSVFSYASTSDIAIMIASIIASVIAGALNPLLTVYLLS